MCMVAIWTLWIPNFLHYSCIKYMLYLIGMVSHQQLKKQGRLLYTVWGEGPNRVLIDFSVSLFKSKEIKVKLDQLTVREVNPLKSPHHADLCPRLLHKLGNNSDCCRVVTVLWLCDGRVVTGLWLCDYCVVAA